SRDSRSAPKGGVRPDRSGDRDKGRQGRPSFDRSRPGRDSSADRAERPERVIRAEAKVNPDDSPFAVLRRLVQPQTTDSDAPAKAAGEG
ncbi:MAG TPA: hypothetical protein PKX87_09325, partial [Alphaproteobacteria bacterium]|nr:hypothetical protein [Alphaproteobacteria bacterium]